MGAGARAAPPRKPGAQPGTAAKKPAAPVAEPPAPAAKLAAPAKKPAAPALPPAAPGSAPAGCMPSPGGWVTKPAGFVAGESAPAPGFPGFSVPAAVPVPTAPSFAAAERTNALGGREPVAGEGSAVAGSSARLVLRAGQVGPGGVLRKKRSSAGDQSAGGRQPALTQARRAMTRSGRLRRSAFAAPGRRRVQAAGALG